MAAMAMSRKGKAGVRARSENTGTKPKADAFDARASFLILMGADGSATIWLPPGKASMASSGDGGVHVDCARDRDLLAHLGRDD
jgi:hypothetical protein